ncbi:16S rRNA methyltransferase [Salimicrobium jeotgali]|uniref:16S rRNA methyltransferase n=1 Tax=Salimicrobium jeotgali TaxID=1230341 RepID=K2FGX4_9BACI|nr:class I SAM-dependent methyltransferase [Salimicrobium jeotgali]AKG05604.1 16S rRNA methyltransferase [Salimicrobium jeotgali]EKE30401.1 putative 16S rRNA methyltransferase [Salimicrobium jeotgali]MBM7696544.1 16S rRNA (guanine1207-N2)-methyltransferase [Salimicrobium jeotgali]
MTEHYYSRNTSKKSERKKWSVTLQGKSFTFFSDHAVFSKDGVDFGSRTLVETFTSPEVEGDILDIGCGYGPIGLALASDSPSRSVVMVDVNARALELAKVNAEENGINNVEILESDGAGAVKDRTFAAVVTNPPIRAGKKTVHRIFEEAAHVLKEGGELWVVIQKKQGAPSAETKLKELFKEVHLIRKNKGYYIFKAKKV